MWRHRARTNVDDVFRNEQLFGIRRSNVCSQSIFAVSLSSNSTSSSTQLITQFVSHFSWRVSDDATRKIFAKCYLFVVNVFMFSTRFFFLVHFLKHFAFFARCYSTPLHSESSVCRVKRILQRNSAYWISWWSTAFHAHGLSFIDFVIESLR